MVDFDHHHLNCISQGVLLCVIYADAHILLALIIDVPKKNTWLMTATSESYAAAAYAYASLTIVNMYMFQICKQSFHLAYLFIELSV